MYSDLLWAILDLLKESIIGKSSQTQEHKTKLKSELHLLKILITTVLFVIMALDMLTMVINI